MAFSNLSSWTTCSFRWNSIEVVLLCKVSRLESHCRWPCQTWSDRWRCGGGVDVGSGGTEIEKERGEPGVLE